MYVVLALLLLGVLIIAHEGGHFWAARACGIGVQEFSMGMGAADCQMAEQKGDAVFRAPAAHRRLLPVLRRG